MGRLLQLLGHTSPGYSRRSWFIVETENPLERRVLISIEGVMNSTAIGLGALFSGYILLLSSGCSTNPANRDYNMLYTDIDPLEYARILCRRISMQDRHTCLTSVIQHYHDTVDQELTPEQVVSGPFVVVLQDDLYRGNYVSQPFAAAFTVSNGVNVCRGRYNAFAGDTEAVFKVFCDDGSRGSANIMLDQRGRNGIGVLQMNDGTRGDIVFGYTAVGGAFL